MENLMKLQIKANASGAGTWFLACAASGRSVANCAALASRCQCRHTHRRVAPSVLVHESSDG